VSLENKLSREFFAELIGTAILVFFGLGAVHASVLAHAQSGIWQVAVVWGVAVTIAIYVTGAVSGAHLNPAITIALAAYRGFPIRKVPIFILAQLAGAISAATILYSLFGGLLCEHEAAAGIVRSGPGSELSAMVFAEYFPNPCAARDLGWPAGAVSHLQAMLGEGVGTAFLAFFVFALTDGRNRSSIGVSLRPVFIGLGVSIIISVVAPLTQAGLNPARDLGPRLLAYLAGWGAVAIPGPRGGFFTVYILAPILGALAGGGAFMVLLRPGLPDDTCAGECSESLAAGRME
jgi:glycerol uptake facilitator protein